jgi:hypothetical protein
MYCAVDAQVQAQVLGDDFDKLSAKERSRIAKEEEANAAADARYQSLMTEAELLFRDLSYDAALERFEQARALRPFNVYPKVKIQDLQALIAKRDAALAGSEGPLLQERDSAGAEAPLTPLHTEPRTAPTTTNSGGVEQVRARTPQDVPVQAKEQDPVIAPSADGERIYKEGRAVVVERQKNVDGQLVVFRKVTHPWGEVVYFKDGSAVPQRVWTEAFGAQ